MSEHPAHDHERTDVQAPVLGWMALVLAVFLVATMPLLVGVFKFLKFEDDRNPPVQSPLAKIEQPPAPRLQAVPSRELGEYRQEQRALLDHYGWVDQQQKVVRIPIAAATELLVKRGLPKVPPVPPTDAKPGEGKSP